MSLADHADNRRQPTITTKTTITSRYNLCEINAACCILSASSALSARE